MSWQDERENQLIRSGGREHDPLVEVSLAEVCLNDRQSKFGGIDRMDG